MANSGAKPGKRARAARPLKKTKTTHSTRAHSSVHSSQLSAPEPFSNQPINIDVSSNCDDDPEPSDGDEDTDPAQDLGMCSCFILYAI
jgi:hypothetical protein